MMMKKIRIALWALVAVAMIGFTYSYLQQNKGPSGNSKPQVIVKNFGGDFTLTNHLGEQVTQDNFKNKNRLIYFGFTYCPAICPTELQRIATVLNTLDDIGETIEPIFVTIDPERDTVQVMKDYISLFHSRMVGLTGTPEQTEQIKKAYKIYAAKVQDETMSDYTMDHSSFIYFIDESDSLVRIFKMDDSIEHMVKVVTDHIKK